MDERRTVKLGETYRSFAEVERRVIPIISKCLEGMVSAGKAVDERRVSAVGAGRREWRETDVGLSGRKSRDMKCLARWAGAGAEKSVHV